MQNHSNIIIDVFGKRTLEYVFEVLAKFNRGISTLTLRSLGGSISKGVEIARILKNEFGISIENNKIETLKINVEEKNSQYYLDTACLKITLKSNQSQTQKELSEYKFPMSEFIDFPIYHLLFDWLLGENKELHIFTYNDRPLISVIERDGEIKYRKNSANQMNDKISSDIGDAFYRGGLLLPNNWQKIAKKLSEFDDVLLGIDTNILYNCTISEHLIPAILLINTKNYVNTPNWILLVVPSAVMHEIEESANIRSKGFLQLEGRMGFRALQEIIELGQSTDISGVSLVIVGEANPILDTRVEIQGLRKDFFKREKLKSRGSQEKVDISRLYRSMKTSSGDMIIRDQFKAFLKQINFHKGIYFLTADKSNTALARTEGLHPIYFPFPFDFFKNHSEISPYSIETKNGEKLTINVPLGKLIYEMAVQFGTIKIKWNNKEITVQCDTHGETLDYWICRNLKIGKEDFNKLLPRDYTGVFDLNDVTNIWHELTESLIGLENM